MTCEKKIFKLIIKLTSDLTLIKSKFNTNQPKVWYKLIQEINEISSTRMTILKSFLLE